MDLHRQYVDERARLDPVWATRQGIHDHDDRLTRYDDASYDARRGLVERALRALEAVDPGTLPPEGRIDYELFRADLAVEEDDYRRRDLRTLMPGIPVSGVSSVHELLIKDFAPREKRVACAIGRLRQVGWICADLRAKLGRPPLVWTTMALEELAGALVFLDEVPALAGDAPGLAEAVDSARRALTEYREFVDREIRPRSDGTFAIGREAYDFRLKRGHLLSLNSRELAALGRREFDYALDLLREQARRIDPRRGWEDILDVMMRDHPSEARLLDVYREEVARARRFMTDRDIVSLPDEKLEIIPTPAFLRSSVPFAAYLMPAPLDASRLGHFYVTPEPEAHVTADIPGTVWHEAYPGHHLQFLRAKEVPSLVRRLNDSPLLSEGWGLYCEELARETGYYDDPRERLMQLNWRLQRAARVILDVGIHAEGTSYEGAVKFLMEEVRMGKAQAEASVNAYTQSPTYFACYLVGMLEIVRIRERFRERLGPRFSLREFHDRLLGCGNVPPALIERELERTWK